MKEEQAGRATEVFIPSPDLDENYLPLPLGAFLRGHLLGWGGEWITQGPGWRQSSSGMAQMTGVTAVWQGEGNEAGVERLPGTSAAVKLSFS